MGMNGNIFDKSQMSPAIKAVSDAMDGLYLEIEFYRKVLSDIAHLQSAGHSENDLICNCAACAARRALQDGHSMSLLNGSNRR